MDDSKVRYKARFYHDGSKRSEEWLLNGEPFREDHTKPVFIEYLPDGYIFHEIYMKDGKLHREDGPARIMRLPNNSEPFTLFYINGEKQL